MTTDGCLSTEPYIKVYRTTYAASRIKAIAIQYPALDGHGLAHTIHGHHPQS